MYVCTTGLGYNTFVVEHAQEKLLNTGAETTDTLLLQSAFYGLTKQAKPIGRLSNKDSFTPETLYIKLNKFPFCSFSDFIGPCPPRQG
jgi:hypothetical protein